MALRWFAKIRIDGKLTRLKGLPRCRTKPRSTSRSGTPAGTVPTAPAGVGHRLGAAHCTPKGIANIGSRRHWAAGCACPGMESPHGNHWAAKTWSHRRPIRHRRELPTATYSTGSQSGRILVFARAPTRKPRSRSGRELRFVDNVAAVPGRRIATRESPSGRRLGREHDSSRCVTSSLLVRGFPLFLAYKGHATHSGAVAFTN